MVIIFRTHLFIKLISPYICKIFTGKSVAQPNGLFVTKDFKIEW